MSSAIRELRSRLASRRMTPRRFVRAGGRQPVTSTVVVCAGDSITNGIFSADYVAMLQNDCPDGERAFVNAGVNSDLSFNLLGRLDDIIACRPDVVTILIGTNDVAAHINRTWRDGYIDHRHLPEAPTLRWFRDNLDQIVTRLRAHTNARLAVIEIPPLGEDLGSIHNNRVITANAIIREVGATHDVAVLPLMSRLIEHWPTDHRPPAFDGSRRHMISAAAQRFLLRRRWDDISARQGLILLTDFVHLNTYAARKVADLIEEFVTDGTEGVIP